MLGRFQRVLLYGGGVVLSVGILAATAYGLWADYREYVARQRASFQAARSMLNIELHTQQAAFSRTVASAELIWTEFPEGNPALVDAFAANGGRQILAANPHAAPLLALGELDAARSASAYARYLALTERMGSVMRAAGGPRGQPGQPVTGMFYSPDKTFATLYPPERAESLSTLFGSTDVRAWIDRLAPPAAGVPLRASGGDPAAQDGTVWLPPDLDPLTGDAVVRVVRPAFDGADVFAVFVRDVPVVLLRDTLNAHRLMGELMVLDRGGRVVVHSAGLATRADTTLGVRGLQAGTWRRGFDGLNVGYRDGVFTISHRVRGTDWVLAYFWSWRTMAAALAPEWLVHGALALGVLVVLWGLLVVFDRRVFRPVLERSSRVFESEALNRTIVALAPVGIGLFSLRDGSVLLANDAMRQFRQLGGERLERAVLERCHRIARSEASCPEGDVLEWEWSPPDARESIVLTISMVCTRYRSVSALLCVASDITTLKRAERAASDAREAADGANRMKTVFLASMSHEMRTPLNAILGHLELLRGRAPDNDTARRLGTVANAAQGLLALIDDILDVSKAESGGMALEDIPFDLHALVRETAEMLAPLAAAKSLGFYVSLPSGDERCFCGDPARIRQILVNLAGNAIKFTSAGRVTIDVGVCAGGDGMAAVTCVVADTGIGIAPDRIATIFDLFRQADPTISRRFGGTGLGLTLCKRLVDLMGGTLDVQSAPGAGSTFRVVLPLKPAGTPVERDASVPVPREIAASMRDAVRVLVVDDHPFNRELLADQLAALGYAFDVADGGRAAIRQMLVERYDIVLTDVHMPDMDGIALAMCLRDSHPGLPVVAVTAATEESVLAACRQAGVVDVLRKPLSVGAIDHAIRRHVDRARSEAGTGSARAAAGVPLSAERLETLARESARLLGRMGDNVGARLFDAVRADAHAMKGAFAMIGERAVVQMCEEIEHLARNGESVAILAQVSRLGEGVDEMLSARRRAGFAVDRA
ncbi:hypothetical protein WK68_13020 [Burkholderia ubonensis]|uniref:hybrid sensor histidine kinase/response regulator n=1 Tax=Burkholderia ubonensis TaxID=101571 RepID=UPI00075260D2|nr:hybrid sensor histidine kinase/response regulator [Burkholderia ubonensis]KVU40934.1 hypothetical protein WK68_13020 [Burkholderia ubonensis]